MEDQTTSLGDALSKALEYSETVLQLVKSSGEASRLDELANSIKQVSILSCALGIRRVSLPSSEFVHCTYKWLKEIVAHASTNSRCSIADMLTPSIYQQETTLCIY